MGEADPTTRDMYLLSGGRAESFSSESGAKPHVGVRRNRIRREAACWRSAELKGTVPFRFSPSRSGTRARHRNFRRWLMGSRAAITVDKPREEVRRLWDSREYPHEYVDSVDAFVSFRDA